jgi:2-polyprenyl-3-methyl-5-hydroxy-6-metoxy-1,4-benzoquinol methylase
MTHPPSPQPQSDQPGYDWERIQRIPSHAYLAPAAKSWLLNAQPKSVLDIGCGDGRLTDELRRAGVPVRGVDFAPSGIEKARRMFPDTAFDVHDLGQPLPHAWQGAHDVVTAVEVIEHMLLPREIFRRADEALAEDGRLLITTPYHGYWKNLAMAATGKLDKHFTVLWDYGHVKFFSVATLKEMGRQCGFELVSCNRVGRIPMLAASMVAVFRRATSS